MDLPTDPFEITSTSIIFNSVTHNSIYSEGGGTIGINNSGTYTYFYQNGVKIGVGAYSPNDGFQIFFGTEFSEYFNEINTGWTASPALNSSDLGTSPLNASGSRPIMSPYAGDWFAEEFNATIVINGNLTFSLWLQGTEFVKGNIQIENSTVTLTYTSLWDDENETWTDDQEDIAAAAPVIGTSPIAGTINGHVAGSALTITMGGEGVFVKQ